MKLITNYEEVFNTLVKETSKYIIDNNIKAMILGISGGIDSTVCAAICHEVSKQIGIPLIGRSLPTKYNKEEEIKSAKLVGEAFCNSFTEVSIKHPYDSFMSLVTIHEEISTPLSRGNIQARLRMIYLYNLASIHNGIVIDTDNLTENNLGYWTIHGDVGEFNPIGGLWKTEVFKLAEWYLKNYVDTILKEMDEDPDYIGKYHLRPLMDDPKYQSISKSLKLKPTAGLGITNNDLEELGAESYEQIDNILQEILRLKEANANKNTILETLYDNSNINSNIINNIVNRHFNSEFKRKRLPIVINRHLFF